MARVATRWIGCAIGCLLVASALAVHSTPSWPTYRAASIQYNTRYDYPENIPSKTIAQNMVVMLKVVASAASQGADIVVFPEGGTGYFQANLNGSRSDLEKYAEVVPNVDGGVPAITPCTNPSFTTGSQLKTLSCAARDNEVYVVLNMADLQPCSPGSGAGTPQGVCPDDGMYLYDASVVFSPTGQIITKYWKFNLFSGDFLFNRLAAPELKTFNTTFGVRFGMFICFDIMFRDPAVAILNPEPGVHVTDIIFSTDWINGPPFTATAMQQGYSRSYGVNLIASNNAWCTSHCGGGVYHKGEILGSYWRPTLSLATDMVIVDVPKIQAPAKDHDNAESPASFPQLASTVGTVVDCKFGPKSCNLFHPATTKSGTLAASSAAGLSCSATFSVANATSESETWALQALDYNTTIKKSPSVQNLTSCVLLRCDLQLDSHGIPYCHVPKSYSASMTTFSSISLTSHGVHADAEVVPMYTVGGAEIAPTNATTFTQVDDGGGRSSYKLSTTALAPVEPLFVFAIQAYRSPLHVNPM